MAAVAPVVSFCATNLNTLDRLPGSLASVRALGEALRVPFEIVVADGPSDDGASQWLADQSVADPRLQVVHQIERNRGRGRRLAFETSRGQWIIPFDTSLAYDPRYGPILARYLAIGSPKFLFSEIVALPRDSVEAAGGWRDLIGGEDVDLYARVMARFGVIAYPTGWPASQSAKLGSYARQMRYVQGGRFARFRRILAVQRDQLIGSHATVGDLMAFNRTKSFARRVGLRAFFTLAAIAARFSPIRPAELGRNNYLLVREGLLESFLAGDWHAVAGGGPPPKLPLTQEEVEFLALRSSVYRDRRDDLAAFVVPK
ncbi:MAG: glycosyltransferase [Thermoplasmata archaeon]|nr:glycosyltransferase [Thermoplasmata archaeon]